MKYASFVSAVKLGIFVCSSIVICVNCMNGMSAENIMIHRVSLTNS